MPWSQVSGKDLQGYFYKLIEKRGTNNILSYVELSQVFIIIQF